MHEVNDRPPILDFGGIGADMSLTTNYFPKTIPQADYMVCRSVTWGAVGAIFYQTQAPGNANSGEHMHGENGEHEGHTEGDGKHEHVAVGKEMQHIHDTLVGPKYRSVAPGDRVLVAWVGDDACVIDLIYPASAIG
jgi:hypothetical protein